MICHLKASCQLPISDTNTFVEAMSFDCGGGEGEVVALVHKGKQFCTNDIPFVRIHSACLTGEVFGSQKCDCGYQFRKAMKLICQSSFGIMLYMAFQEGRGIGLTNKIRAYKKQEHGLDTLKANEALGFAHDLRDFLPAAAVLNFFDIDKVKLITNNPSKVKTLVKAGINVVEAILLETPVNKHNKGYLFTKRDILHHSLKLV